MHLASARRFTPAAGLSRGSSDPSILLLHAERTSEGAGIALIHRCPAPGLVLASQEGIAPWPVSAMWAVPQQCDVRPCVNRSYTCQWRRTCDQSATPSGPRCSRIGIQPRIMRRPASGDICKMVGTSCSNTLSCNAWSRQWMIAKSPQTTDENDAVASSGAPMWPGGETPGPNIAAHMQPASSKATGPMYLPNEAGLSTCWSYQIGHTP